jgi:predicted transcriptional regulator
MTNNPSSVSTTISIRVSHQLLARIDKSAKRAGQDRNSYILQWLPENYGRDTARVGSGGNGQRPHPARSTA